MIPPLQSLIQSGTKLWIDSVDPALMKPSRKLGATGATSNPIIIANILGTGIYDDQIRELGNQGHTPEAIAWTLTDELVTLAEKVFLPVFTATAGDDGYVSFELDPLLEDVNYLLPQQQKVAEYLKQGKNWAKNHANRLIKVPGTPAGICSLEPLVAEGVNVNVTLLFSENQYRQARESVWRGAQRRKNLDSFKSVFSIFVSRIDVYSAQFAPSLSAAAQGMVGIVNAKNIWQDNLKFWQDKPVKNGQEIVFASTGVKDPKEAPWKYVQALAGSDIQTNPPTTNEAVEKSKKVFTRDIQNLPSAEVLDEIQSKIDWQHLEDTLMSEGLAKFSQPQHQLLETIQSKLTFGLTL